MNRLLSTAVVLFTTVGPAFSSTLSMEEALFQYNVVTSGNLHSNQEVEGRVYVGGDLTGSTLQTGFKQPLPAGSSTTVVVEGNSSIGTLSGSGMIAIRGNAATNMEQSGGTLLTQVGGTFSGNDNFNTVTSGLAGDPAFEAQFDQINFAAAQSYSTYLSTLTGSPIVFADPNNKAFNALDNAVQSEGLNWDASNVTVYHTTISDIQSGTFSTDINMFDTLIINVSGSGGSFGMNPTGDVSDSRRILWNFHEATSLNINAAIWGSVLAPNATLTGFNGSTEGSVFADAVSLTNGELHLQPFEGDLPTQPGSVDPSPVPLPAGAWMLILALGGLLGLRRFG